MAGCDNCYYKSPKVGTKGPEDSPFVIVGESPGIEEMVEGKPFIGDSGKLLDKAAADLGGWPIEPYYTNAIGCLPRLKAPENVAAACLRCRPRLTTELTKHPRKLILSLGGTALQSLTGDFGLKVTKERGKIFPSEFSELGVLATVHPAFLLRGGGNLKQFMRDLKYAIELLKRGNDARMLPNGTEYKVLRTPDEVDEFENYLDKLPPNTKSASDLETTGFNHQTDRILYLGMQTEPLRSRIIPGPLVRPSLLTKVNLRYVWHNGKFDCRFTRWQQTPTNDLQAILESQVGRVDDDTMLMSYTLNERRGIHDLDQSASDWLGSVNHKDMVQEFYKGFVIDKVTGKKRRRNLSDAPPELVERYIALDINDTYHLDEEMKPLVFGNPHLKKFYTKHCRPASEFLLKVELNGMLTDPVWIESNYHRLTEEAASYEATLQKYAVEQLGHKINPNSTPQVKALLYGSLKLAPMSWGTGKNVLDDLYRVKKHPALNALRKYRVAMKSRSTYVIPLMIGEQRKKYYEDPWRAKKSNKGEPKESVVYPDFRTHCSYLIHGTPTSRLATRDNNMQNIPRDPHLRGMYIARPGYGILDVDYSQAELRSLAALSKCPELSSIFLRGLDLHNEFTAFLFGPGWTKENKMAAKTVNFGIPYGREAASIADDPNLNKNRAEGDEISVEEAQSWIDGWAKRFPGAWAYIQKCREAPAKGQTIITAFGNMKRPGVVSQEKLHTLQNESANFPHQSTASNLTVRAGIELIDILRRKYDTFICNTVHDCLVMEVPAIPDLIQEVAKVCQERMEEIPTRYGGLRDIPFKAEAEFGHRWGNQMKFPEIEALGWDLSKIPQYIAPH